jgi:hypothetical protein
MKFGVNNLKYFDGAKDLSLRMTSYLTELM